MSSCGKILTFIFMYSGDGNLVLSYMLLMPHPNLDSGVDIIYFTRILVVSNPDVSVLFSWSYYNIFHPAVILILLG